MVEGEQANAEPPAHKAFEPGQAPEISFREASRFYAKLLGRHKFILVSIVFLGLIIAGLSFLSIGLILPLIESIGNVERSALEGNPLGFMTSYLEPYDLPDRVRIIAVGMVLITLVKGIVSYGTGRVIAYLHVMVERDLREDVFDQLMNIELKYLHGHRTGHLQAILSGFPRTVAKIPDEFLGGVPRVATFFGYAVALFAISWELTLLAIGLAIVATWSIGFITRMVRQLGRRINEGGVGLRQMSLETIRAMKVVRLFAREDATAASYRESLHDLQWRKYRAGALKASIRPVYSLMNTSLLALVLIASTYWMDTTSDAWLVLVATFMVVSFRLLAPASSYARKRTKIAGMMPAVEEVIEFLRRDNKPYMVEGDIEYEGFENAVRFDNVRFRYEDDLPDVIHGVSFEVPKGRTVALVGGSGAGKSTLVNILARLYDPTGGRVAVDGRDLREFKSASWRRRLAVVSQDTFLFRTSVRENIRYARPDATDAQVEDAARRARAHEFIVELDDGYDTIIGGRGVRLSGGQAQRIAIARALLADPDILILDEATSALDTATERLVQAAIEEVSKDRTVVAIAHRLSTIRGADRIIVLEDGHVVEEGTHDELLRNQAHYWSYVQMQRLLDEHEPVDGDADPAKAVADNGSGNGRDGAPEPGSFQRVRR